MNVISWLESDRKGPWRLSHLVKQVYFFASSVNISFKWIPRKANLMADVLAKRRVVRESTFTSNIMDES